MLGVEVEAGAREQVERPEALGIDTLVDQEVLIPLGGRDEREVEEP